MASLSATFPGARRSGQRGDLWRNVLLAVVALFVVLPVGFLILGSFSLAKLPTDLDLTRLGINNYVEVWLRQNVHIVFYNTMVYVTGATVVGVGFAALLAWLVERTNMPGKIWIYAGVPLTLAVPGLLQAIAWVLLLSPQAGFFNRWLMSTFELSTAPFNIKSMGGMIFVEGLRLVPTAFLMLIPLLRSMDPSLEEAAAVSGARPLSMLRRITIGLMAPGLFAVTIYQAMTALEVFEVPGVLGIPANIHVFSTRVYSIIENIATVPAFGQANALAMIYLLIAVVASYFYFRLINRSERYAVVTGKAYRPRVVDLGRWRVPMLLFALVFLFLSIVLPYMVLLYASLVGFLSQPSIAAFKSFSFNHYIEVIEYGRFQDTLRNTIEMVVGTASVVTVMSFLVSLVVVRSRFWGRKLLDQLAFMPHAIPGIVMGLAFLWLFLETDHLFGTRLFGTVTSIVIGFSVLFLAYGTRAMNAAILQLHKDLEEASATSGAPPWRTMMRIFVPLMMPTFIGVWVYVVLLSVRLAGLPLMLFEGRDNGVLAVLIWYLWDEGNIEAVAAIGVMLMSVLFVLILLLRLVGFGRDLAQTGAQTGSR
jgi:iron(III) transport system permease protein